MKKLLTILFIFISAISFGQAKTQLPQTGSNNTISRFPAAGVDSVQYIVSGCGAPTINMLHYMSARRGSAQYIDTCSNTPYWYAPTTDTWYSVGAASGDTLAGGAFTTSNVQVGFNPGTNISTSQLLLKVFYGLKAPTATLTGGTTLELTNASTVSRTLNWSGCRQSNTPTLTSIVVATVSESFAQPAQNACATGTQAVSVPANVTTVYSNIVTASDGQTATANTTFIFDPKIYAGFVSSNAPSDANILAATGGTVGGIFGTTINQSGNLSAPASSKYIVFAAPESFGTPTVTINGLVVEYNLTTRAFINASGYSQNYILAVSPFPTSGGVSYVVQ